MDYVAAEARKAKRGMWRGTFMKPWERRITAPRAGIHALGSGRDATAGDGSAIFQSIGLGQEM